MKKSILAIFSILLLASCSKSDDDVKVTNKVESKYRIEISHEGNKDAFTEHLELILVSSNSETAITPSEDFESTVQINRVYTFYPPDNSIPTDRELETSPIETMLVSILMSPIEENSDATLETTVRIFKDDVWIKTHTKNFKGLENEYLKVDLN